jgi:hypothetical protein
MCAGGLYVGHAVLCVSATAAVCAEFSSSMRAVVAASFGQCLAALLARSLPFLWLCWLQRLLKWIPSWRSVLCII